jgi:2-polyprenyl-6-methoxyphenol hydroxylase-like FAD-dependent oxidoreductase
MRTRDVLVAGAGMAGLSAALALSRDGHRVTLIERDVLEAGAPEGAFEWDRRGVTHFLQPHQFAPRGARELREAFPDVHARLFDAGAGDVECSKKVPGAPIPADDELRYVAVRRPVIEWALRRALIDDGDVTVVTADVTGLRVEDGRVTGVVTSAGEYRADAVVDALGRRSPMRGWLEAAGLPVPREERGDCGVIYYSRYYRVREGASLPDGPWYLSPRGDLGYCGYASFPGDAGTFAGILAIPPGDRDLKVLRDPGAFEAAVALIPDLHSWTNADTAEPITPVLPMGSLHNTFTTYECPVAGLFPVGDALSHTDPVMALGLSFALVHARCLAATLRDGPDIADAAAAYIGAVSPEARERFELALDLDDARLRMWMGQPADVAHRDGDYGLFSLVAGAVAATVDPDVFRVFLRRIGMLDRTAVLDDDVEMQERIERRFAEVMAQPRRGAGPGRDELLAAAVSAARG